MNWPTSQDYNEAIQNPGSAFADAALKSGEVTVNAIGLPVPRSGNFADVYEYRGGDGKRWALKCFTRKVSGLQERYALIDEHIAKAKFPFTVGFKYLAEGIRVRGQWFPVLKMEWVEGFTLNEFVRENASKRQYLHALMQMWAKLCGRLRDGNFAHADLQHGNVLLVPGDAQNKLGLRLIDYDGMWVPALAERHSGEVGHPNFQHPLRLKERLYNADVDRFPHLVIAAGLRATLIGGRALWDRFDNGDNLLFKEADLRDPANAPVFKALWDIHDDVLCALVGKLALASREPLRKTPWLDDVLLEEGGQRLGDEEEQKVMQMLGVSAHFTASKAVAAPAVLAAQVENDFSDFGMDGSGERPIAVRRAPAKSAKTKYKPTAASHMPYYIGGGVLALALVGAVIALTVGGKKNNSTQSEQANGDAKQDSMKLVASAGKRDPVDEHKIDTPPKKVVNKEPGVEEKKDSDPPVKKEVPVDPPLNPFKQTVNVASPVSAVLAIPKSKELLLVSADSADVQRFDLDQKKWDPTGRHERAVRCIAVSPDGAWLASGGDDTTLRIWSREKGQELHVLRGHVQSVQLCAFSPDSTRVVSVGRGGGLCEWDIVEGKRIRGFTIGAASAIAYLPDGKSVLVGTPNESAVVFDLEKQQRVRQLPGHMGKVNAVCIPPNGNQAYIAGDDSIIRVWNLSTGELIRTLEKHKEAVLGLASTPDGRLVVSAGADNQLGFWITSNGRNGGGFASPWPLRSIAVNNEGDELILGIGADGGPGAVKFVHLANADSGPPVVKKDIVETKNPNGLEEVWKANGGLGRFHFSSDREKVMAASHDSVRTFSIKDSARQSMFKIGEAPFSEALFLSDDKLLIRQQTNGPDAVRRLYCWDIPSKTRSFEIEDDTVNLPNMAVASKANLVLLRQKTSGFNVYSLNDGKKLETVLIPGSNMILSICCSDDGEAVLAHTAENRLFYRPKKGSPFSSFEDIDLKQGRPLVLRLSPNGQYGLQCGNNNNIQIYSTATGRVAHALTGHASLVRHAEFTPDSRHVVSVADSTIRVWDVETGQEKRRGDLAGTIAIELVVSPDGLYAVTSTGPSVKTQLWRLPAVENAVAAVPKDPAPDGLARQLKEIAKVDVKVANYGLALSNDGERVFAAVVGAPEIRAYKSTAPGLLDTIRLTTTPWFVTACPDGASVASGNGRELNVYNPANKSSGVHLDVVKNSGLKKVSFFTKDNAVLLPTGDGTLGVFSVSDGKLLDTYRFPSTDQVSAISIPPNSRDVLVLTAMGDVFFKAADEKEFRRVGSYPKALNAELSPDGKQFVIAYDLSPTVYETATGRELVAFESKFGFVRHAIYLRDGKHVISAHNNGFVRLWDARNGKLVQQEKMPSQAVYLTVSEDGRIAAAILGGQDGGVRVWKIEEGGQPPADPNIAKKSEPKPADTPIATSPPFSDNIADCFYSSDGKKLYVATAGGIVYVLDPLTLEEIQKYNMIDGRIMHAIAVPKSIVASANPSKEWIYVLDDAKTVHVFDSEKGAVTSKIPLEAHLPDPNRPPGYTLTATPDTQTLLLYSRNGFRGTSWNIKKNAEIGLDPLQQDVFRFNTHGVVFSSDKRFGGAQSGGKVLVWNVKTGATIAMFITQGAQDMAIVADANVVAVTGMNLAAWNFLTGKEIWNEKTQPFRGGIAAIPKSKRLAYCTQNELVIRDCVKGEELSRWKCPENSAQLTASNDGKYLVSYSNRERKMSLWAVPPATPVKK